MYYTIYMDYLLDNSNISNLDVDKPQPANTLSVEPKPALETKEQLINKVRDWVRVDNELRVLQKEMLIRKKEKQNISKELMNVMKMNKIDVFDLKDGQLVYASTTVKKPITKKNLLSILSVYFQGNNDKAFELNNFILDNRETTVKEKLVRKFD
jgi:Family of unknown function (DUF5760)